MNSTVIYIDKSRELVDTQQIQDDYPGPLGQNWQWSDMTATQAEEWVAKQMATGYSRGHCSNP